MLVFWKLIHLRLLVLAINRFVFHSVELGATNLFAFLPKIQTHLTLELHLNCNL